MVPSLETERLRLEKVGIQHYSNNYLNWLNDKEVYRFMVSQGGYTEKDLRDYLEKAQRNEESFFWAIIIKDSNRHIGNVKIESIYWDHGFAEYGIMVGDKENWGKGYGREASQCVFDFCFDELKLRKINLGVVVDNVAAVKLYKKMGFSIEGVLKYHVYFEGKYRDSYRMAIFNPNFLKLIDDSH